MYEQLINYLKKPATTIMCKRRELNFIFDNLTLDGKS